MPNPYSPIAPNPYEAFQGQVAPPPPPPTSGDFITPPNPYTTPEGPKSRSRFSRRALLIGGAAAAIAGGIGITIISRQGGSTIQVPILYSTEKGPWLNAALTAFNQSTSKTLNNKTIQIQLTGLGSVDSQSQILGGQIKPIAWSPASNLEMARLNYKWQQAHNGKAIISTSQQLEPQSLVNSPLVLLSWKQRAQQLLSHYQVNTLDWPTLASAFRSSSWVELGGQQGWGKVKFGQTVPEKSNSGLLTITLLAYKYFNEPRSLTPDQFASASKYWDYLNTFEQAVNSFGCSSGTYLNDLINAGPAQADIIATYENLALTSQKPATGQPLLIFYPDPNILSDHPFAVLQGDWVTDEQSQAALRFRDFLLAQEQQMLALSYGFRPGSANSNISLLDSQVAGNPFVKYINLFPNHQPDPVQSLAKVPGGDVVDALITGWDKKYNNTFTTLDC
jgi:Ca-activated chloride channel family protein